MLRTVTKTGNVSIPKEWRDELGIKGNTSIVMERRGNKIVLEPLSTGSLKDAWKEIDEEIKRKGIKITMEEAINASLYD